MTSSSVAFSVALVCGLCLCSVSAQQQCEGKYCDVYGRTMAKCDRSLAHDPNPGFQSTGYFRDNFCTASSSDAGSHYVCVDLPNATVTGKPYSPFWVVSGQAR